MDPAESGHEQLINAMKGVTQAAARQEYQKSSSPRIRNNTFEGAKCSTHFPRLTRLGQWTPRVYGYGDKDAFITGSNCYSRHTYLGTGHPRQTCLGTNNPRLPCLGTCIRYSLGSKLKTCQTPRGKASSGYAQSDSSEWCYSLRDARDWKNSKSSSPGWPEPVFLRDSSSLGIYEYLLMY